MAIKLNHKQRIKNMACLYHAINIVGPGPVNLFIGYDGSVHIESDDEGIAIAIARKWICGERSHIFTIESYDPSNYDEVIYDEYNCFYRLSLLEACHLILDIKDYFDVKYGL